MSDGSQKREQALTESEERYRQFFELESDALVLVENETGRVLEVNAAAVRLYGYTRAEWLGMKHTDVSAEPDKTREVTLRGQAVVPLRWHRRKDGTSFPVEITAAFWVYQGRPVHMAAIRDITERHRLERERESLIAKLESALAQVKELRGLLPICACCKRIRNDAGDWDTVETYLRNHTDARLSHGLCPSCLERYERQADDAEPGASSGEAA